MFHRILVRFFLCVFLLACIALQSQHVGLKNASITFEFPAKEVKGTISGFSSSSKIDWEQIEKSVFKGSVETETLDTNNGLRNWSLRGSRYFNAKLHPRIYFESSRVELSGSELIVDGILNVKGTERPFKIAFTIDGTKMYGRASLYSSDFGIKIKKNRQDNLVNVFFEFDLLR